MDVLKIKILWSRYLLVHLAVDVNCEECLTDDYLEVDANMWLMMPMCG